jgi:hypothetical protein
MPSFALILLIAIVLVGFCVFALAISIIIKKNGKFPEREIGKNRRLRKLGLRCPKQEEMVRWRKDSKFKIQDSTCSSCSGEGCALEEEE